MNDGVDAETAADGGRGDGGRYTSIITILFAVNNNNKLFEATLPFYSGVNAHAAGGFGGVPASGEAITGLKRQKHGDDDDDDDAVPLRQTKRRRRDEQVAAAAECTICLEEFEIGDGLAVMPCEHRFHDGCLTQWLKLSRLCPCCRHALPAGDGEAARPTLTGLAAAISAAAARAEAMTNAAEGGGAAAAATGVNEESQGTGREAETRRRSQRARQANVRLFGPEWAADTSDDSLGLPH